MDLEPLLSWNPHWQGEPVSSRILKDPGARALADAWTQEILGPTDGRWGLKPGPRQVGKTTTLGHVASRLITHHGFEPRRVAIVPLDDDRVRDASDGDLEAILRVLMTMQAPTPDEPNVVLLDEVQAFPRWAPQLKVAWDRHHDRIRLLATGSSALRILRPADADFHGRIRIVTVHPMKFREVIDGHPALPKHTEPEGWRAVEETARRARAAFLEGHAAVGAALEDLHGLIVAQGLEPFLAQVWLEYCAWGGYPASRPGSTAPPARRLDHLEGALNTVLVRDVVQSVRKLREFRLLFRRIVQHPGGKFEPYAHGRRLGIEGAAISHWKRILEDVMLVQQLEPLKPNLDHDTGPDKAYPADPAWVSYFRGHAQVATDAADPLLGARVESVLVDHVRRLQFNLVGTTALPIGYVARPEVDVAANLGPHWLLLESKYGGGSTRGLEEVGGPTDVRVAATRDAFHKAGPGRAHAVPAHEFALLC